MIQKLYCIYDEEAQEVLPAFYAFNEVVAKRMVKNTIKAHKFKNFDLDKLQLNCLGSISTDDEGKVIFSSSSVCKICNLSALIDKEISKAWDNELLAQSMTKCFEMALSKFITDNKKE